MGRILCKWCRTSDHKDIDCPKQKDNINMIVIEGQDEVVMAITRVQTKKATYPNPRTKKERI